MVVTTRNALWEAAHAERAALADDLATVDGALWARRRCAADGRSSRSSPISPPPRASARCAGAPASWARGSTSSCTTIGGWPSSAARRPTPDETLQRFRRVIHHQHHVGARAHRCLAR